MNESLDRLPGGGRLQAAAEAAVGGSLVGLALRRGRLAQQCVCGEGVLSILPRHGSYRRICVWRASGEVSQAEARDPGPGGAGPGPGAGGPGGQGQAAGLCSSYSLSLVTW